MPAYTNYDNNSPHAGSTLTLSTDAGFTSSNAVSKQAILDGSVSFQFANPSSMEQVKLGLGVGGTGRHRTDDFHANLWIPPDAGM